MYYLQKHLSVYDKRKTNLYDEKLNIFDDVIRNRTLADISTDVDVLRRGNELFFNNERDFWSYDEQALKSRSVKRMQEIFSALNIDSVRSYCDVGCGYGENLWSALQYGCSKAVGIDIRDRRASFAVADERIQYYCVDITQEKVNDQFELVTSFCAFEHFENPILMLEEMKKLVKEGGYLFIEFSPIWNSADGHHMYRNIQFPYYHLIFTEEVIEDYKKIYGYKDYNWYNKWSGQDYMTMFLQVYDMQLVRFSPMYNLRDYYFVERYPQLFCGYGTEELLTSGFRVIYKKMI